MNVTGINLMPVFFKYNFKKDITLFNLFDQYHLSEALTSLHCLR